MKQGAVIYHKKRYRLWRIWDDKRPLILFILLNPSIADTTANDPTIRRLISFAQKFNYGGLYVGNLYAHITPYPEDLRSLDLKSEQENIKHVKGMMHLCEEVVYAWGNNGMLPQWLKDLEDQPLCFGYTKSGQPKHPLYLSKKTKLVPFSVQ